jgi:hypothetical protein
MSDWLTYAQASERFGVSAEAVRLRARRLGWRTQPGNDVQDTTTECVSALTLSW